MIDDFLRSDFWGYSAAMLGTYEALSFATGRRLPTVSTVCARRRWRRAALTLWLCGLTAHIVRHEVEELIDPRIS